MSKREILRIACWAGLASGLADVLVRLAIQSTEHRLHDIEAHAIWLGPLANAVMFAIAAAALIAAGRIAPRLLTARAVFAVFLFLGFLAAAIGIHRIALWSTLVLALGASWQGARFLEARAEASTRVMRRTLAPMAAVLALAAAGIAGSRMARERRALGALPAAPADAPNVLFLLWDTVRGSSLSLYGLPRPTSPRLEQLGARGLVFDRAVSPSSYTLASHASFFTGRWPFETSVTWRTPLDRTFPTLAEVLASRGWSTAAFSANNIYVTRQSGLDRGFAHFESRNVSFQEGLRASALATWLATRPLTRRITHFYDELGRRSATASNEAALRWIAKRGGRPWFVFMNYYDAHSPYLPRAPWDSIYGMRIRNAEEGLQAGREQHDLPLAEAAAREPAYEGAIAGLDFDVGTFLDSLAARGALRNTLIIVASDHGEEFGRLGLVGHGFSVNYQEIHVPLVMVWPGHLPARRVDEPVSLRTLPTTIARLIGIPDSTAFPGYSLLVNAPNRIVLSETDKERSSPASAPVSQGDLYSLVRGPWQLLRVANRRPVVRNIRASARGEPVRGDTAAMVIDSLEPLLDSVVAGHARHQ